MSRTIEEIQKELDAKIPRSVVSERDGGGGRKLSYLEGHYVIDRLNQVFGALNWSNEILDVINLGTPKPSYLVKVRLTVHGLQAPIVKEGYGYGSDKSANSPHELAIKEAVTDGLKVAAKNLGMSMGLALYDKTQENVDDGEPEAPAPSQSAPAPVVKKSVVITEAGPDPEKLREVIRSHVKAAIKKGVLTMEQMKEELVKTTGHETLDKLDLPALNRVLESVKKLTE